MRLTRASAERRRPSGSSAAPAPKVVPTDWSAWQAALPVTTPRPSPSQASPTRSSMPVPVAPLALTRLRAAAAARVAPDAPATKAERAAMPAGVVPQVPAAAEALPPSWPSSAARSSAAAVVAEPGVTMFLAMARRRGRAPPLRSLPATPARPEVSAAPLSLMAAVPAAVVAASSAVAVVSASTVVQKPAVAVVSPVRAAPWASR